VNNFADLGRLYVADNQMSIKINGRWYGVNFKFVAGIGRGPVGAYGVACNQFPEAPLDMICRLDNSINTTNTSYNSLGETNLDKLQHAGQLGFDGWNAVKLYITMAGSSFPFQLCRTVGDPRDPLVANGDVNLSLWQCTSRNPKCAFFEKAFVLRAWTLADWEIPTEFVVLITPEMILTREYKISMRGSLSGTMAFSRYYAEAVKLGQCVKDYRCKFQQRWQRSNNGNPPQLAFIYNLPNGDTVHVTKRMWQDEIGDLFPDAPLLRGPVHSQSDEEYECPSTDSVSPVKKRPVKKRPSRSLLARRAALGLPKNVRHYESLDAYCKRLKKAEALRAQCTTHTATGRSCSPRSSISSSTGGKATKGSSSQSNFSAPQRTVAKRTQSTAKVHGKKTAATRRTQSTRSSSTSSGHTIKKHLIKNKKDRVVKK